jgi:uncharacterized protein YceK
MVKGKKNGFLKILVMLLVFAMMLIGCKEILTDIGSKSGNEESADTGLKSIAEDSSGNIIYTLTTNKIYSTLLKAIEGTDYVLTIKMKDEAVKTSRGIINEAEYVVGYRFILQPSVENSSEFSVTLSHSGNQWNITSIDGEIAVEEVGGTVTIVKSPGRTFEPGTAKTNKRQEFSFSKAVMAIVVLILVIFAVAFLIGFLLPKGKMKSCPSCHAMIEMDTTICPNCGAYAGGIR